MDERSLKLRAEVLLRSSITQREWAFCGARQIVQECVDDEDPDALVQTVKELRRYFPYTGAAEGAGCLPDMTRSDHDETQQRALPDTLLRKDERRRAVAYSAFAAMLGAARPSVLEIRAWLLGGRLLTPEEARSWVRSPVAALLEHWKFESLEIPYIDHFAVIGGRPPQLRVDPGGHSLPLPPREYAEYGEIRCPDGSEEGRLIRFAPGSLIDELALVVNELRKEFPWEPHEAVEFVLCGTCPSIAPLKTTMEWRLSNYRVERATVTIEVEPWISASTVEEAYRAAQKQLLAGENRLLRGRGVDVLEFCARRLGEQSSERLTWRRLMTEWNRENPTHQYSDPRAFLRDFRRVERRLLMPRYQCWPEAARRLVDSQTDSQPIGRIASDGHQ